MPPIRFDPESGNVVVTGTALAAYRRARSATGALWSRTREFAGFEGDATYLVPRWVFLRMVALIHLLNFVDLIRFGTGMIGEKGVYPVAGLLPNMRLTDLFLRYLTTPSLFWLGDSDACIVGLAVLGTLAALALLFGLWPRGSLFFCWLAWLSFASVLNDFAHFQHDVLLLETTFLAIFFAPSGFRPGLGRHSPPRPITVLALRWLLWRLMFESGTGKFLSGDIHWRNFTAMDIHQETSPLPTFFGYIDHHLPHWYHVLQCLFMIVAEIVAPFLALASRRGRLVAFFIWTAFQIGIELTGNYAFLNFNAVALGVLLLDDQLVASVLERLRLARAARLVPRSTGRPLFASYALWRKILFYGPFAYNFYFTVLGFAEFVGVPPAMYPTTLALQIEIGQYLRSANSYHLYRHYVGSRHHIEFQGSNDGGKTWRTYQFRYQPQELNVIPGMISPYFARFESTIGLNGLGTGPTKLVHTVARKLLEGSPDVAAVFRENPFPDAPPDRIAVPHYEFRFTSLDEYRKTGNYWTRRYVGDFAPVLMKNSQGKIREDL